MSKVTSKENLIVINNLEINKSESSVLVSVNPKIYWMEVIFSAAYIFIDKAYVVITGDPEKEVFVLLKTKDNDVDLESLGRDFNNELLNYAVYFYQSELNKDVKNAIVQKTLFSDDDSGPKSEDTDNCECEECKPNNIKINGTMGDDNTFDDLSYEDDPMGIAKPWDEESENKEEDTAKDGK